MSFPVRRLRRLRGTGTMRRMLRESVLSTDDLVSPVFVQEDIGKRIEVESMPDIPRLPLSEVADEAARIADLGIPAVMLFGIPAKKDERGSAAYAEDGIVQKAASAIKAGLGDRLVVMTDVCLCQYTSSGHCGLVRDDTIENDPTLKVLGEIAVSQALAGSDVVSPSAMMDGQVSAIRESLDDAGCRNTAIMSHSAKHRSSFYAPFRDAASCAPEFGDRSTYQVPYTNAREAMSELEQDVIEGVDILMIKPALAYLDLISEARRRFDLPVAAYSVSGEYALIKAASERGWIPEEGAIRETLSSIKRAGAGIIVTYFAKEAARLLRDAA